LFVFFVCKIKKRYKVVVNEVVEQTTPFSPMYPLHTKLLTDPAFQSQKKLKCFWEAKKKKKKSLNCKVDEGERRVEADF
jgi:hypothetical protein